MPREYHLINRTSVIDRPAVAYYKTQCKDLSKTDLWKMENRDTFSKIIQTFWKEVAEDIVENPNGVFIDAFGYFCLTLRPKKKPYTNMFLNKVYIDSHTQSRQYYITFINFFKKPMQRVFVMDGTFRTPFKKRIVEKIKSGVKYKNHVGVLIDLFKRREKVRQ